MPKSTFDEESENHPLDKGAFPTFRAIPSKIRKIVCSISSIFFQLVQYIGRGWRRSWHYFLTIIIIIAILYAGLDIYATAQLNHQLNLIKQKGEPVAFADAAPPMVPDSQNAAILYERANQTYTSIRNQLRKKGGLSDKEITARIEQNKTILNLIREATTKQKCRFDLDWSNSIRLILPEGQMRQWARLFAKVAGDEANSGDINAALQDTRRIYILANHVSQQHLFISTLVARDIESLADATLGKVLLHGSISISQARAFKTSLPVIDWQSALHRSLITERASMIGIFQGSPEMHDIVDSTDSFSRTTRLLWRALPPLQKLDETYSLQDWKEILDDVNNSHSSFSTTSNAKDYIGIDKMPWYALISKMMLPIFSSPRRFFRSSEVRLRQCEIALALAAYHTQYHQYPTTLAPAEKLWKSTFPLDLYNNKPFHYKSNGKTFLLYSVGVNGKDDGGEWKGDSLKNDIVWGH